MSSSLENKELNEKEFVTVFNSLKPNKSPGLDYISVLIKSFEFIKNQFAYRIKYGFQEGHSTEHVILYLNDEISRTLTKIVLH